MWAVCCIRQTRGQLGEVGRVRFVGLFADVRLESPTYEESNDGHFCR